MGGGGHWGIEGEGYKALVRLTLTRREGGERVQGPCQGHSGVI